MEVVFNVLQKISRTPNDAVMFDIDDTLIKSSDRTTIQDILRLLNFAKSIGYKIVIITARHSNSLEYTKNQLQEANIKYDELIFASARDKGAMKRSMGYRFVLSCGDLLTDCTDTLFALKLPGRGNSEGYFSGPLGI